MASPNCPDCGTPYVVGQTCYAEHATDQEKIRTLSTNWPSLSDAHTKWGDPQPCSMFTWHPRRYRNIIGLFCYDCGKRL